jgi:serine/threonine protein kinase
VRIFDLVETQDGTLALVMELLRGASLAQSLASGERMTNEEAVAVAVPILSALSHAHALGIVHRDVTPSNIVLAIEPDGEVTPKLIDFGVAKVPAAGDRTADGRALGTPRYMAPEHIRGQPLDGRADLFSLGVVLYEAITGVCPFDAGSASASLASVLETEVDPDPIIAPRVWLELRRALAKRPYERAANATAMAEGLRQAVGKSDSELASLLRRAPPDWRIDSPSEPDAAWTGGSPRTPDRAPASDPSKGTESSASRPRPLTAGSRVAGVRRVAAGVVVLVLCALTAAFVRHRIAEGAATSGTPPVTRAHSAPVAPVAPAPAAPPPVATLAPDPPAPASSPTKAMASPLPSPPKAARPTLPASKRLVGQTPGF